MLFVIEDNGSFKSCESTTTGRKADSIYHRIYRNKGFTDLENDIENQTDHSRNLIHEARQAMTGLGSTEAMLNSMKRFSMFERYILENYSTTAYGQGLQEYLNILENRSNVGTVDFKIIPKNLVECYLLELRKKGLSGGTIKSYHGVLKTVCNNMGFPFSIVAQHNKMIQTWINEDISICII